MGSDARYVAFDDCEGHLDGCHPWVREPLAEWLAERWVDRRDFRFDVAGADRRDIVVTRRP